MEAHACHQVHGPAPSLEPIDSDSRFWFVAKEDVLHDGELRDKRKFLVNDRDSRSLRRFNVLEFNALPLEDQLPLKGSVRINAG